jgi:hypothetical protein
MGGTDETPFGDLRVARGYRVRSATASAAGRDQSAAPAARAPAAAEVTPFRPQFVEAVQPVSCHVRGGADAVEPFAQSLLGGAHADGRQHLLGGEDENEVAAAVEALQDALQKQAATQVLEGSVERWK